MTVKILLADDHNVLRQGVAELLNSQADLIVVAQASNAIEVFEKIKNNRPDLAILDINMPGDSGIEITKKIKSTYPEIRVLLLTMHKSDEHVLGAIDAGADGYILKEAEMDELLFAVRSVAEGHSYMDPSVTGQVFSKLRGDESPPALPEMISALADKDIEILRLLGVGKTNQEIALDLGVTEKTIRNRLSMVFRQIGVSNRTEAALFVIEHGLNKY